MEVRQPLVMRLIYGKTGRRILRETSGHSINIVFITIEVKKREIR
jgi:hypothetical protein